jgi:hypothetical protein
VLPQSRTELAGAPPPMDRFHRVLTKSVTAFRMAR